MAATREKALFTYLYKHIRQLIDTKLDSRIDIYTLNASDWTEQTWSDGTSSASYYIQEIEVYSAKAEKYYDVYLNLPEVGTVDPALIKEVVADYGLIDDMVSSDGKLTFVCYGDPPTHDISVVIRGM